MSEKSDYTFEKFCEETRMIGLKPDEIIICELSEKVHDLKVENRELRKKNHKVKPGLSLKCIFAAFALSAVAWLSLYAMVSTLRQIF